MDWLVDWLTRLIGSAVKCSVDWLIWFELLRIFSFARLFVYLFLHANVVVSFQEPQQPVKKTKEEIQEEEELQLALAISQSEAEAAKNKPKQQQTWNSNAAKQEPQRKLSEIAEGLTSHHNSAGSNNHNNGDLDKYLNRQYWEEKKKDGERFESSAISASSQPSAPTPSSTPCKITTWWIPLHLFNISII